MRRRAVAALVGVLLGLAPAAWSAEEAAPEHPLRRFESVFFITLPFASLYSTVIVMGVSAALQKGKVNLTLPYQVAAVSLACGFSGYSAWRDASAGGPELKGVGAGVGSGTSVGFTGYFRNDAGFIEARPPVWPIL